MVPILVARLSSAVIWWPERLHLPEHGAVDSVGGEALLLRQQLKALLVDEGCVGGERQESRPLAIPMEGSRVVDLGGFFYLSESLTDFRS